MLNRADLTRIASPHQWHRYDFREIGLGYAEVFDVATNEVVSEPMNIFALEELLHHLRATFPRELCRFYRRHFRLRIAVGEVQQQCTCVVLQEKRLLDLVDSMAEQRQHTNTHERSVGAQDKEQ
jgi:hypothetical protein